MAVVWKLARVGTGEEKTLTDWQIRSATRSLVNQGLDTLALGFAGNDLLGNSPFAPGETLRLDRVDGGVPTTVFRGQARKPRRGAYGATEAFSLQVDGPWRYLEKAIYTQLQRFVVYPLVVDNPVPIPPSLQLGIDNFEVEDLTTSQIALAQDEGGSTVDSRAQILLALNFAIAKGVPIALGTIDDGIAIPRDAIQDVTCAEIILKSLRWTPDQSIYFDYSVDPPTINIRTGANRTALEIDIADEIISEVEINPADELAIAGVTINYLRRHQRTGIEFVTLDKDQAGPDPEGIGALIMTLELYGSYSISTSNPNDPGAVFIVAAEPVPEGLAASLYGAYSSVPYEGRVVTRPLSGQGECEALPWTSRTLSILNGVPEWATAAMLVQQSREDIFAGRTELTVGPPRQLGAQDLVGLVRKGRTKPPILSSGFGPVIPAPPNPAFPPAGSTDPRVEFNPTNTPDLILYAWRGQGIGGGYGVYAYDFVVVYQSIGGIGHGLSGSAIDIGSVVDFFGAKIGRGQDKYIPTGGALAPHNSGLYTDGLGVQPNWEIDAFGPRPFAVRTAAPPP